MTDTAETFQNDGDQVDDLQDEFLGALAALGGSAGNGRLREVLDWDEVAYHAVKAQLLSRGLIVPGRGRGGSVALVDGDGTPVTAGASAERPERRARAARGSGSASASSFETAFRAIDDCLRKEAGCGTELDYTEQTSWLLFLKYLDGLEDDRAAMALLEGRSPSPILEEAYRWNSWAAPKDASGQLDHHAALTGDDLRDFVNQRLFPYLERFKERASGSNTIEYKIGEIFGEIRNKISSGYNLREIIDLIDGLQFRSQAEKHELSMLYEEKIKRMGNAGRNGGEYYTPRPLIRAMVQVVNPQIGETVYDPAVGSAGFLCEAFEYMRKGGASGRELSTADLDTLQTRTFTGKEKKSLAYVIAIMNMILHGIEAPNIIHANTLTENLSDVQE
ncbi:MAG: N-6 DNA methylase, partial [Synechococcaceae cyanobacterium]|nr:N-6 DNA methylase [Synechococcaceae cyanobacterium]